MYKVQDWNIYKVGDFVGGFVHYRKNNIGDFVRG